MLELRIGRVAAGLAAAMVSALWPLGGGWAQTVYVEDSPAAMELAERAEQWRAQGRLSDAVNALVNLGQTYPGKLMPVEPGRYVDATAWVRGVLRDDAALREAYVREAEPVAARALAEALARRPEADELDAGEWFDAEALAAVGREHWATPSGLAANLAWCGVMLERGQAGAALAMLDGLEDHASVADDPDMAASLLGLRRAAEAQLERRAAWAARRAEAAGPAASDVSLREPVWTAWWEQMDRVAKPASRPVPAGVALPGVDWPLADEVDPIEQIFGQRARMNVQPNAARNGSLRAGGALTANTVYVSDGLSVAAVDRSSGRPRWSVGWPGLWSSTAARGSAMRDRRGVAVLPDSVVAVLGPSQSLRPRMPGLMLPGSASQGLWSLDRATGATRWRMLPEDLGEGFRGTQFVGVPIEAVPGVLTVGVRRVQASGFVDAFVVGLDAGSGAVRWTRHLASTADAGGTNTMPVANPMVAAGGRLFVDDGLGVVAAIDPRSGGLHWLRTLTPSAAGGGAGAAALAGDLNDEADQADEADPLPPAVRRALLNNPARRTLHGRTGPAWLPAGLLVAELAPNAQADAALLLDPDTGQVRRRLTPEQSPWIVRARWHTPVVEAWAAAREGANDEADQPLPLVVQNQRLWLIDGRDLSVVWRDERTMASDEADWPPLFDGGQLYVAAQTTLRKIDLDVGPPGRPLDWDATASLIGQRGELFRVSPRGVSGLVSPKWSERRLRERINNQEDAAASAASDPEPGLALATLGIRTDQPRLLLDGVDAALRALDAIDLNASLLLPADPDTAVSTVLELIQLVAEADRLPPVVRREAFDRVAAAVTGPEALVAYHLAMGPLEREADRPVQAVEHFQAVLQDPLLAAQTPRIAGTRRRAGLEARRQLSSLIAEVGFEPYASFDALARGELERGLLESPRDPERFEALAERFPLALAASDALVKAGDLRVDSETPRLAVRPYQQAYNAARSADPRDRAAGRLAELYLALDRPDMARGWLRRVKQQFPNAAPWFDRAPAAAGAWEARLADLGDPAPSLPVFDPTATLFPWAIQGTAMRIHEDAEATVRRDLAVLQFRGQVTVVDPRRRRVVREAEVPARDATIYRFTDDQLVLASSQRAEFITIDLTRPDEPPRSISVDAALRGVAVPEPENPDLENFNAQLDAERVNLERLRRIRQAQQQAQQLQQVQLQQLGAARRAGTRFYATNDALLFAGDPFGRVVAFDRFTGDMEWAFAQPGVRLEGMHASDEAVLLTGRSAPYTDAQQGVTLVLDPITGQLQGDPIYETPDAPLDARMMPDASLLVTYPTFVAAYAPGDHRLLWRSPRPHDLSTNFAPPPVLGSAGDGVLAMRFPITTPRVLLLDADTGSVRRQLVLTPRQSRVRRFDSQVNAFDGRLHVLHAAAETFAADGRRLWQSAVDDPRLRPVHQALAQQQAASDAGDRNASDGHLLVLSERTEFPLPERPQNVRVTPTYVLHAYERDTGRLIAEHGVDLGRATTNPNSIRLYDHAYAVPAGAQTVFLNDRP